jgi:membrane protease YdiL (CAAX protease family)
VPVRVQTHPPARVTRRQAWLEILLVVVIVEISGVAVAVLAEAFADTIPLPVLLLIQGVAVLAGLTLLLARTGQRWGDVGFQPFSGRDLGRALLLFAASMGANVLVMLLVYLSVPQDTRGHLIELQAIASRVADGLPLTVVAAVMFFVGVYEELTARGFLLARCLAALDGVWAPVLLSSVLFGLGHFYQGWIGVLQTAVFGVILATFTVRWRTLWPAILAHAMVNTLSIAALAGLGSR